MDCTFRKHKVCKNSRRGRFPCLGIVTKQGFRTQVLTRDACVRTKPGRIFKIFLPFAVKFFPLQPLKINFLGPEKQHSDRELS